MEDIYNINKYQLGLGKIDTLNEKNLVLKNSLENALNNDIKKNDEQSVEWYKLSKTNKLKKIKIFSQQYIYMLDESSNTKKGEDEIIKMQLECWNFLRDAVDKKRLNNRDIEYDIEEGVIINIKSLVYNIDVKRFALKRVNLNSSSLPVFKLKNKD
jgi:hypothetical protein